MKWMCQTQSLGGFEKFRKAAVSFVVSFCLSVRPHGKRWQQSGIAEMRCYVQIRSDVRLDKPLQHILSSSSTQLRYEA